jgi:hypothetical protein
MNMVAVAIDAWNHFGPPLRPAPHQLGQAGTGKSRQSKAIPSKRADGFSGGKA